MAVLMNMGQEVSIRAPAWGATLGDGVIGILREFQFALPHGERRLICPSHKGVYKFQFALPHGERLPTRAASIRR